MSRTSVDVVRSALAVEITAVTQLPVAPGDVWAVLADTATWAEWNPFVRSFDGTLREGEQVSVRLQPGPDEPRTMRPRLVSVEDGHGFTWLGRVGVPGVLDGRHSFAVEPVDGGTRFRHHERLSGLLVPAFRPLLTEQTPRAFVAMNEALADRVLGG